MKLNNLPGGFRWLKKNVREDMVVYFETFTAMLEEKTMEAVRLPKVEEWQLQPAGFNKWW